MMIKTLVVTATITALLIGSATSFAEDRGQDQRDCMSDALNLCGQFVPNEKAIIACMTKKVQQLSPACRRHFQK